MLIFSTTILNLRCSYIHTLSMNSSFSAFQQSFQLSKKLFSNSIMRHCVWRVTTFASCVQKIFKNKYQLFTSEAGSNHIFSSTPNQGKVGQSNSKQSKEGAWPFQQQVNTPHVYSILILPELQKRADRADQSVLFFLAGANFWEKHAKNRRKQVKTRENRQKTGVFWVLIFGGENWLVLIFMPFATMHTAVCLCASLCFWCVRTLLCLLFAFCVFPNCKHNVVSFYAFCVFSILCLHCCVLSVHAFHPVAGISQTSSLAPNS